MAKKKGGKKKRQNEAQITQGEQPEQTQLQTEPVTPEPVSEPAAALEEERKEPALTDAVSEVLGDQKPDKKEKKFNKKFKSQLAKFSADGYDVSSIEAMMETATSDELKAALKTFENGIEKVKSLTESIQSIDPAGIEKELDELKKLLSDPMKHEQASELLEKINIARRSGEIMSALNKMVLPSMKSRVEALKVMLQEAKDLTAVEAEFSTLKKDYKEAYAEEGVKAQVVMTQQEPAQPEQKARVPMVVKDIFLLYRDGKFISHHTNRVISKEQQKDLFADLKTGRDFLRSPKYVPQKLNVIPGQNRNILVQSGRFTVVIVIAEGSVHRLSENITTKVITLMEKEDLLQLKDWKGDVSLLKSSGKYMQALLFAFMKLSNQAKQ